MRVSPASIASPPRRGVDLRRRRLVRLGFLTLLIVLGAGVAWYLRRPLLPIPVPPGLATLDPQVRQHLARLATAAAGAPADPVRRADLGLGFAVNGLWAEARVSFVHSLELGGPQPLPSLYAAVALKELGDEAGAIAQLREVVRRFPDFAPAWHRLGTLLNAVGEVEAATEAFAAVTRLAPSEWRGWAGLGESQLRSGQVVSAIASLERARDVDPTARSVRHLLGQAYRAAGRAAEAEAELAAGGSQTLSPMPDDWSAAALDHMKALPDQLERIDTLMARGEIGEAIARAGEALRFHSTTTTVLSTLARALTLAGRAPEAWAILGPALVRWPEDLPLLTVAVDAAAALERADEAMALAHRAVAQAPRLAEAHVALANALLAARRDEEAVVALQEALTLAPGLADLWVQFGDLLWQNLRRSGEALEAYRQARALDPLGVGALQRLADLQLARGELAAVGPLLAEMHRLNAPAEVLRDLEKRLRQAAPPP